MKRSPATHFFVSTMPLAVLFFTMSARSSAQDPGTPTFNVLSWQIDVGRTGQNLTENTLVSPLSGFGQLCSVPLDGPHQPPKRGKHSPGYLRSTALLTNLGCRCRIIRTSLPFGANLNFMQSG